MKNKAKRFNKKTRKKKNKKKLLDDITEVLASATFNNGSGEEQDFDHIPEIALVSGRVGTNFTTASATSSVVDPDASLSNFVNMIQAQKQLQYQQRLSMNQQQNNN